jgi:hypothetical protein
MMESSVGLNLNASRFDAAQSEASRSHTHHQRVARWPRSSNDGHLFSGHEANVCQVSGSLQTLRFLRIDQGHHLRPLVIGQTVQSGARSRKGSAG